MDMQSAIQAVADRRDLDHEQMTTVMKTIMTGEATDAQMGAFLMGLRLKGETVTEIAAAAAVMRELAVRVAVSGDRLVDTAGTGGDGASTFNVSSASALVAAGAGARVAKHGNRSASSRSGSADVFEAAGVRIDLPPEAVARCIDRAGIGFMFAPRFHGAMRFAVGPRREIATRTVFNLLGPLTNPAAAPNQVIGVFSPRWVRPLAEVLRELGARHVLVVHSDDGLDEISVSAPTLVAELRHGEVTTYRVDPESLGVPRGDLAGLRVPDVATSLAVLRDVLEGGTGPARDIVVLNAGAAVYVAGCAESLAAGVEVARGAIASGAARERLAGLVAASNAG